MRGFSKDKLFNQISFVKVQQNNHLVGDANLEMGSEMGAKYPQLFEALGTLFFFMFEEEHNF